MPAPPSRQTDRRPRRAAGRAGRRRCRPGRRRRADPRRRLPARHRQRRGRRPHQAARARLNRFFSFGGYGSDSTDRGELTRAALKRASVVSGGSVTPDQAFVVGDTPQDVAGAHGRAWTSPITRHRRPRSGPSRVSASAPDLPAASELACPSASRQPKMGDHWPERKGRAGWVFAWSRTPASSGVPSTSSGRCWRATTARLGRHVDHRPVFDLRDERDRQRPCPPRAARRGAGRDGGHVGHTASVGEAAGMVVAGGVACFSHA